MDNDRPRARLREPITGWRVWNVSDDGPGPRLWPAGSGVDEWQPRHPVEARCGALRILTWGIGKHTAPDLRCRCGIYASRSLDVFERPRPAWPPTPVVGTVSLWGTVVEHERGWRGQFAYPARLRLVCAMCAWFEPGLRDAGGRAFLRETSVHAVFRPSRRDPGPRRSTECTDRHGTGGTPIPTPRGVRGGPCSRRCRPLAVPAAADPPSPGHAHDQRCDCREGPLLRPMNYDQRPGCINQSFGPSLHGLCAWTSPLVASVDPMCRLTGFALPG